MVCKQQVNVKTNQVTSQSNACWRTPVHVVVVSDCSAPKKESRKRHPTHNLQLDGLAFEFNSSDLKVNTNSADITLCVRVVCETEEKTRLLNDTSVSRMLEIGRRSSNVPFRHQSRR
jgi:hypothetical protein